jgi:hypothetical protein
VFSRSTARSTLKSTTAPYNVYSSHLPRSSSSTPPAVSPQNHSPSSCRGMAHIPVTIRLGATSARQTPDANAGQASAAGFQRRIAAANPDLVGPCTGDPTPLVQKNKRRLPVSWQRLRRASSLGNQRQRPSVEPQTPPPSMPSITTAAQYALINLGPLTATFSAPSSCSTGTDHVFIGQTQPTGQPILEFSPDCTGKPQGDCFPSASRVDSAEAAALTNPAAQAVAFYYSPGLVCPSNWATAGAVAKSKDGSFSTSGVFSLSTPAPTVLQDPSLNVMMNAIDPGETAVACCPRYAAFPPPCSGWCRSSIGAR